MIARMLCGVVAILMVFHLSPRAAGSVDRFVGRWQVVKAKTVGVPTYGNTVTISTSGKTITILKQGGAQAVYRLDGTTSGNTVFGQKEDTISTVNLAEGVLTITTRKVGSTENVRRRLSLDADGFLSVETTFVSSPRLPTLTVYSKTKSQMVETNTTIPRSQGEGL